MRNSLRPSTWKRLTCCLALAGAALTSLIVPASPGGATPVPQQCAANQSVIRVYYSDSARLHAVCQDIVSPQACRTYYCDATPYYKDSCGSTCSLL